MEFCRRMSLTDVSFNGGQTNGFLPLNLEEEAEIEKKWT